MSRPLDPAKKDNAVSLYLAGKPMVEIKAATGVSPQVIYRELSARGIPSRRKYDLPGESVAAAYRGGASEFALSRQYDVSRAVIGRVLEEQGVTRRTPGESVVAAWATKTPEERTAQTAAAHRAPTRVLTEIDRLRRALRIESSVNEQSDGEQYFSALLRDRGIMPTPQRAVGPYNIDFALPPVAVEILGGGWHSIKAKHAERIPYILDQGWHLVMIWNFEGRSALGSGAADYFVTFLEEVRRNPPATCQYRVITGQGELLTACGREADEFPLEPPPRGRLDRGA